ncbi:ATP-binding protein [Herbaspirillum sp. HC18]|nr:ATP-binding protein [Herbaspirillum sp. HC18]
MTNLSLRLPFWGGRGYGAIPGSSADIEQGRPESPVLSPTASAPIEVPAQLKIGAYEQNKKVFDAIWNASGNKSNWFVELAKKEGLEFGAQLVSGAIVTAAIYFVSTTILEKTPDMMHLLANVDDQHWLGSKIAELFSNPDTLQQMASFISLTAAAGNVGNNLVITQAVTGALSRMGEPISELLKALILPQQGTEHEAKLKQNAFRNMTKIVAPLRESLPKDRREKFDFTHEELRGEIDAIGGSSVYPPDYNKIKRLFDRLYLHLSYPIEMEDTYQLGKDGDPGKAKAIQKAQDELTSSFMNPEVSGKLDSLFMLARYSTVNPEVGVVVAMFNGPPSTGKTYIANQFANRVQNARLVKMSIEDFLLHTGVESAPPSWGTYNDPDLEVIKEPHRSRITDADSLNEVILIDEVNFGDGEPNHRHLMEALKAALTVDPKDYPAADRLKIKANARPVVILCTNHGFDSFKDKALASRFSAYIDFPNWSREAYEERISEKVVDMVNEMGRIHRRPVVQAAQGILQQVAPFILEELARHDSLRDDAKLYLREVHTVLKEASANIVAELDKAHHLGSDIASTSSIVKGLVANTKKNIAHSFQKTVDQYDQRKAKPDAKGKGRVIGESVSSESLDQEEESAEGLKTKVMERIDSLEQEMRKRTDALNEKYDEILKAAFSALAEQSTAVSTAISIPSTQQTLTRRVPFKTEDAN